MDDLFGDLPPPKAPVETSPVQQKERNCSNEGPQKRKSSVSVVNLPDKKRKEQDHGGVKFMLQGFIASRQGERDDMQDAHVVMDDCTSLFARHGGVHRAAFYAVFDGHAGGRASTYAAEHLLQHIVRKFPTVHSNSLLLLVPGSVLSQMRKEMTKPSTQPFALVMPDCFSATDKDVKRALTDSFKSMDESFLQEANKASPPWKDGSTAMVVLVINDTIYAANVGDSKAFVVREKEDQSSSVIPLSKDHSPLEYYERMRIQKAGGSVRDGRVLGVLEVSRSLGDAKFKKYGVTALPDIAKCALSDQDRYFLLACDGLWKGFDPPAAVSYVDEMVKTGQQGSHLGLRCACTFIANEAVRRGCADNVTVILVAVIKQPPS